MTRRRPRQQLRTRKSRHRSSFLVLRYELKTRPMGSRFCCKEVFVRDTRSSVFLDSSYCQHPARNVLFPMREEDVGMTRGALIQSLDILFGNPSVYRLTNVCFNKVQMRNLGRLAVSRCSLIQEEQRILGMKRV